MKKKIIIACFILVVIYIYMGGLQMLVSNKIFIQLGIFTQNIPTIPRHGEGLVTPQDHINNLKVWGQKITSGFNQLNGNYFTSLTAPNNQSYYTKQTDKHSHAVRGNNTVQ